MSVWPLISLAEQREHGWAWSRAVFALASACALFVAMASDIAAAPNYPDLTGRIVDNAQLLDAAQEAQLTADLAALEEKTTDQIAVVTVPSLDGYEIEEYGVGLARKWGIGQAGKDNGALLIVAPNERKVRIEVGRRLEPFLTDTMAKLIIENAILPKFRRGDFGGGITDGVRDITAVITGDAEEVKRRSVRTRTPEEQFEPFLHLLVIVAIFALMIYLNRRAMRQMESTAGPGARRSRRRSPGSVIIIPGGSSDWGGGWSGGGGGGGGWSGGGGSFGGGGASGGW